MADCGKKIIYHVFRADVFFHVERMLDNFLSYSSQRNFYILHLTKEQLRPQYEEIFKKHNCKDYYITHPFSEKLPFFFSLLCCLKKEQISKETNDLLRFLSTIRSERILFHGYLFSSLVNIAVAFGYFRHVSWVFWGGELKVNDNPGIKNQIYNLIIKTSYRKMDKMVFLLQGDLEASKVYRRRENYLCPYVRNEEEDITNAQVAVNTDYYVPTKPRVLIGNSGHMVQNYLALSRELLPYKATMTLVFMCNYPAEDDKYSGMRNYLGDNGFNYLLWREIVELPDYLRTMAQADIYVCNAEKQSGLGAIHNAICLGKSIYLRGYNYEWIKQLGFYVETIDQLIEHLKQKENVIFAKEHLDYNINKYRTISSPFECIKKWDDVISNW